MKSPKIYIRGISKRPKAREEEPTNLETLDQSMTGGQTKVIEPTSIPKMGEQEQSTGTMGSSPIGYKNDG